MMRNRTVLFCVLLGVVIGFFLVGCATAPSGGSASASQSDLLKQAGFRIYTATSPEKLTYIQTLPVKKVVLNQYQDKPLYLVCTEPNSNSAFWGTKRPMTGTRSWPLRCACLQTNARLWSTAGTRRLCRCGQVPTAPAVDFWPPGSPRGLKLAQGR